MAKLYRPLLFASGLFAALAAAPAWAVVPEIKIDPETGIAKPHPDLAIALAQIERENGKVKVAQIRWQRAPWHRS